MKKPGKELIIIGLLSLTLMATFIYMIVRTTYFILADYPWEDKGLAAVLLSAEFFGLVHSIGYFTTIMLTITHKTQNIVNQPTPTMDTMPSIAIVVPSYKEPLDILEDTLICFYNLTYQNKYLYLLDDSRYDQPWDTPEQVAEYKKKVEELCRKMGVNLFRRKWRGAKAGIINDFLRYRQGQIPENLEYHPFQQEQPAEPEKYVAVFDADMNPFPDFIEPLVARMENSPNAAFIQTPQYYSNFESNRVAKAAGLQQVMFFEYICEGKGIKDAMFCCGSNVMIRIEALLSVGGFDESSVTEDFATSLKMHLQGWESLYYNRISAFGMGPEDLGAFFKQQFRWAEGTLALARNLPFTMARHMGELSASKWWEYFLSGTHYMVGWFFLIMTLFPMLFLFFNVPTYFLDNQLYIFIFVPYIILTMSMSLYLLSLRNYKPKHMLQSMMIGVVTFPVFIKASLYALFGVKGKFVVTPKGKSAALPLRDLWPQVLLLLLGIAAVTWGLERIYFEREPITGLVGNILWCIYNIIMLSSLFYFNNPTGESWVRSRRSA